MPMLLRSAARRAAALAAGRHHATLRSQANQAARGAKWPAAKASTRSPIHKPPLRTAERRTVKAAGSSAARHTPSSARMRPKPKSVGTAIGVGSRVVDSAGTCGEIVARNVAWLRMRSDAGEERSVRVHSLKPVAPSVGDAVEAHYGTDEDELWSGLGLGLGLGGEGWG